MKRPRLLSPLLKLLRLRTRRFLKPKLLELRLRRLNPKNKSLSIMLRPKLTRKLLKLLMTPPLPSKRHPMRLQWLLKKLLKRLISKLESNKKLKLSLSTRLR